MQYRELQKLAARTDVEPFDEPYENLCLFSVERTQYATLIDYIDLNGIRYDAYPERPERNTLRTTQY